MITNEQFDEEMQHPVPNEDLAHKEVYEQLSMEIAKSELWSERVRKQDERYVELIKDLQAQVASLRTVPKNQRPGKPSDRNRYTRLGELSMHGCVPQQQADIAKILTGGMQLGVEHSEEEVFNLLIEGSGEYRSLSSSRQDVTYLFKYYRGLNKKDGKHEGFVKRGFLKVS